MTVSKRKFTNLHDLILPEDAAQILGITTGTLTIWRSTGRYNLPFVKVGRRVMYNIKDIETFIKERTMSHTGMGVN